MSALLRWDGFLAQLQQRAAEIRSEAAVAARQFIDTVANGGDILPLSHQWSAVSARLSEIESRIEATWHAKVSDALDADGVAVPEVARAFDKGRAVGYALQDLHEELEHELFAELAHTRYRTGVAAMVPIACSGCRASLMPPVAYRTIEVGCACGAKTVYQPNELLMSAGAVATHHVSQHAAVVPWRAMQQAGRAVSAFRPPAPLHVLQQYEAAQIAYWKMYFQQRSTFEPLLGRDIAAEVRARLEPWYVSSAEFEPAWVQAGRPRAAIA
jgi:hypothetical protein